MNRRFLLIANPIAGGGRGKLLAPRLQSALTALDAHVELYFTTAGGDATRRAEQVRPADHDVVVAIGGDGTLNEVLNGLSDPTQTLGLMPVGTANVMAKELDLPRRPEELARVLREGRTIEASIGLVDARRFLLFVSAGIDAQVVKRVAEVRTGTQGKLKYIPPMWQVGRAWQPPDLRCTTADGVVHDGFTTIVATRVAGYAGVMRFPGDVRLDDGILHVFGLRHRTRWDYLRAFGRGIFHMMREGRDVVHLRTTAVRIEGEPADFPWQIDGELGGTGPVDVCLDGRRTPLIVP